MRLERLSSNQFKIFLTFDDLIERGLTKDDLWQDLPSMQALFHDMMFEASDELGFELEGVLLVQVHVLQAQGMLIIVTQNEIEQEDEEYLEMKVTLDESNELIFLFDTFEDIIQLSRSMLQAGINGGSIIYFDNHYYMLFTDKDVEEVDRENIIALLSEYASPSIVTSYRLLEYGKIIMKEDAIKQLTTFFNH
ncbi:Adapter protein MecA 2 [Paraliobacillus sp. PM-2]|uniref:genetic competence negative regulator n=1 Tax=Paraliobacillus sp. PM-2 TaxID=1462524 RepID=UPI00061C2F20|nr:genetic competence negative regulator [Paraliobacillus sp. PM-2]CQR46714.1 Adapter protein MecA 2 [Paraliobacillus sp. PM-2]